MNCATLHIFVGVIEHGGIELQSPIRESVLCTHLTRGHILGIVAPAGRETARFVAPICLGVHEVVCCRRVVIGNMPYRLDTLGRSVFRNAIETKDAQVEDTGG